MHVMGMGIYQNIQYQNTVDKKNAAWRFEYCIYKGFVKIKLCYDYILIFVAV